MRCDSLLRELGKRSVWVLVLALWVTGPCWARIIYVDDDAAPGGTGNSWDTAYRFLQDSLAASEPNDEIRVAQGIYKPDRSSEFPAGTGERWHPFRPVSHTSLIGGYAGIGEDDPNAREFDRFRTILSGDLLGNDAVVIDAAAMKGDPTRLENASSVVDIDEWRWGQSHILLDGLEIHSAHGARGSVFVKAHEVAIQNCVFAYNYSAEFETDQAGALLIGSFTGSDDVLFNIHNCEFKYNASDSYGGAIYSGTPLHIENCSFVGNYARSSGGALRFGRSVIKESSFVGNRSEKGGAIYVGGSKTQIMHCRFVQNESAKDGGAIFSFRSVDINDCTFISNSANWTGGAISSVDDIGIVNCEFLCNVSQWGGGLRSAGGICLLTNCLFVGNLATETGGGITVSSPVIIRNCTSVDNRCLLGQFLATKKPYHQQPPVLVSITNSIISEKDEKIWNEYGDIHIEHTNIQPCSVENYSDPCNDVDFGIGIIYVDPCFIDPGYWDEVDTPDNPDDDVFVAGDYHLKSQAGRWDPVSQAWIKDEVTSPCIDAGDPNTPIGYEPFPNGGIVNMGAYGGTDEASKSN